MLLFGADRKTIDRHPAGKNGISFYHLIFDFFTFSVHCSCFSVISSDLWCVPIFVPKNSSISKVIDVHELNFVNSTIQISIIKEHYWDVRVKKLLQGFQMRPGPIGARFWFSRIFPDPSLWCATYSWNVVAPIFTAFQVKDSLATRAIPIARQFAIQNLVNSYVESLRDCNRLSR